MHRAVTAVIREAREEIGIQLTEDEANFAATVHCRNRDTDIRVGLFFQATAGQSPLGDPYNGESHKCAKIAWYPMTMLPGHHLVDSHPRLGRVLSIL